VGESRSFYVVTRGMLGAFFSRVLPLSLCSEHCASGHGGVQSGVLVGVRKISCCTFLSPGKTQTISLLVARMRCELLCLCLGAGK
jgi:hypothetical protein